MINSQQHEEVLQGQELLKASIPFLRALRGRLSGEVAEEGDMVSRQNSGWDFDPAETLTELDELIAKIEDALGENECDPEQHLQLEQLLLLVYRVLMILDVILTLSEKLPF